MRDSILMFSVIMDGINNEVEIEEEKKIVEEV